MGVGWVDEPLGKDVEVHQVSFLVLLHWELSSFVSNMLNYEESGRKTISFLPKQILIPTLSTSSSLYSKGHRAEKIHVLYLTAPNVQAALPFFESHKTFLNMVSILAFWVPPSCYNTCWPPADTHGFPAVPLRGE